MAENARGQNRNGNRLKSAGPAPGDRNAGKRNSSAERLRDTDAHRLRSDNRTQKTSGIPGEYNISATDYDGQLSDE